MNNYLFSSKNFFFGNVFEDEPVGKPIKGRQKKNLECVRVIDDYSSISTSGYSGAAVGERPIQTPTINQIFERELNWKKVSREIRDILDVTQGELASILEVSEKTVFNIENVGNPNVTNKIKVKELRTLTNELRRLLKRKYSIFQFLNSELPALRMMSPKNYLMQSMDDKIVNVIGLLKRMYE